MFIYWHAHVQGKIIDKLNHLTLEKRDSLLKVANIMKTRLSAPLTKG